MSCLKRLNSDYNNTHLFTVASLQERIASIFPNSFDEPPFDERLVYKVPQDDVSSLAECFSMLEQLKKSGRVVEYAFSQTTLEQVFLLFAKEQDQEDQDDEDQGNENEIVNSDNL